MTNDVKEKAKRELAKAFKEGWDKKEREGFVSPELLKALIERHGLHPDRVQEYVIADQKFISGRGEKPNADNYKTPNIVPLCKPGGPRNDGGI
ncbi:MAG TPA: hypothetical protein VFS88_06795 [Micavibrio sp.]|nr:hypothetical protein [Micavibrio sp.]